MSVPCLEMESFLTKELTSSILMEELNCYDAVRLLVLRTADVFNALVIIFPSTFVE